MDINKELELLPKDSEIKRALRNCLSTNCEDCNYLEYSTRTCAYRCTNFCNDYYLKWIENPQFTKPLCKYHSNLEGLNL